MVNALSDSGIKERKTLFIAKDNKVLVLDKNSSRIHK